MTHVSIVTDPVYLTEPLIKTQDFVLQEREGQNLLYPCEYVEEIAGRARDSVPGYLPGQNPFANEFANQYHIPLAATLGGAETMYPEYQAKLKNPDNPAQRLMPPAATLYSTQSQDFIQPDVSVERGQGNVYLICGAGA